MIKKLIKGSTFLLVSMIAMMLALLIGNKGGSGYILSNKDSGGVPVAHADVPHTPDVTSSDPASGDSGASGGCGSSDGSGGCSP